MLWYVVIFSCKLIDELRVCLLSERRLIRTGIKYFGDDGKGINYLYRWVKWTTSVKTKLKHRSRGFNV